MGYGVGAGGDLGIAFEVLPPPVATSATPTAGGTLTAGTYKYYVTAINASGETTVSNEISGTTSAGNLTLALLWASVTSATGYKIYRTAIGGATGSELLLVTVGAVTTYNDDGSLSPSGALPAMNTASNPGVYKAPTKFIPFLTESIKFVQDTQWRRPIRQSADVAGASPGNSHIEGDIEMEVFEDVLPYFLYCARTSCVKTGTTNYTYVFTPTSAAIPVKTMSITIERVGGVVFGYVGCVVSSIKFSVNNGMLVCTVGIVGRDESSQATPSPVWPTTAVFGAGQYEVEIPTGTPVTDTDTFEFTIEDAAVPQYRMKSTGRGAEFVHYGERTCTTHFERDFVDRADYDAFKAYTPQSITVTASKGTNNSVALLAQQAIKDTYEVNLGGQADLVRAAVNYQNTPNLGATTAYEITVKCQENIL